MDCFVYGTLTDSDTAATLLDRFDYRGQATLSGLHRVDGRYPTLLPGGSVTGTVLRTDEVATLDSYEGVDSGLYVRVTVPRTDGGTVETYVGEPGRLGVPDEWPGDGGFERQVRAYIDGNDVTVRPAPQSRDG